MIQIGGSRPATRGGGRTFSPLGAVAGLIAFAAMAAVALVGLGLAFAFLRGGRRGAAGGAFPRGRVWFGRVGGAPGSRGTGGREAASGAAAAEDAPAPPKRERSFAEVVDAWPVALLLAGLLGATPARAKTLVPMDDSQSDHLKAYGLAYHALARGLKAEWLLNYRGGSFLLPDDAGLEREAALRGVRLEPMGGAAEAGMRAEIADNNMESVALEKVPKVAVYIPPNTPPWDDAVTLALEYADIPYVKLWDEQVVRGELKQYDWLHLHHEDFTGQHGKFYAAYHSFPWYQEEERVQREMAARLGFAKITQLKAAVALAIRDYIAAGGFMFGMCSATDTYDIALSALGVDIADAVYDGDPPDPDAQERLDFGRTLAFKDFRIDTDPLLYRFSDIDVTQEAARRGPNTVFTLFDFSAKNDPVPTMLIQNHVNAVPEFLGQNTGFRRSKMKSGVLLLAEVEGTDEVKYLHGQFGRGTFTFLGGHDPEDYQHMVGDPPTDLAKFRSSPGYRLILNNVLFPAAEKKKQRT
jgi:hypothetical protein